MKKFLVFAMLVVLAISCVAVEAKDLTIAFSQIGQESDWRTANTDSVNGTIEAHEGWTLVYDDAQQKQENQIKALRNFITQGVDYILFTGVVETGVLYSSLVMEALLLTEIVPVEANCSPSLSLAVNSMVTGPLIFSK